VIVLKTELPPSAPAERPEAPTPPAPTVTEYACGVTIKEALY